ncbi:MAG: GldG family protein [Pseudomonadales bacterium]
MKASKLSDKAGLLLLAAVTLVVVAVVNTFFKGARVDLTADNLYTVSAGTKKMLTNVQNPVTLKLFFSDSLTNDVPQLRDFARRVRELLDELALRSGGKVELQVIDPEPFSEEEDAAAELGLQSAALTPGAPEIYFGLAATNEKGAKEVIEFIQPNRERYLEYDIAKMIYIVGRDKTPKAGLLAGLQVNGGFDMATRQPTQEWMSVSQLNQLFDVTNLQDGVDAISEDIDVLILLHPQNLQEKTRYAIDQFALRGGNLLVFVDPNAEQAGGANPMMQQPVERGSDLPDLFKSWGVELIAKKVVGDAQHAMQVNSGASRGPVRHLGILAYQRDSFPADDMITNDLKLLHFASAGALQKINDATTRFTPLVVSSKQSMLLDAEKFNSLFDPNTLFQGFKPDGTQHVLAARVQGPIESAFPDGAPKADAAEQDENNSGDEAAATDTDSKKAEDGAEQDKASEDKKEPVEHLAKSKEDSNIIIVADTDILSNRLWVSIQNFFGQQIGSAFADNGSFFTNAVDNLIGNADLISIRGRAEYTRRFDKVDELKREAEANFRRQEEGLQQRLSQTEEKLTALQAKKEGEEKLTLNPEQVAEVENFQQEKLKIRKQLREVQHQLGSDIEKLGTQLKLINIALIPVLLTVVALVFRSKRRTAAGA